MLLCWHGRYRLIVSYNRGNTRDLWRGGHHKLSSDMLLIMQMVLEVLLLQLLLLQALLL